MPNRFWGRNSIARGIAILIYAAVLFVVTPAYGRTVEMLIPQSQLSLKIRIEAELKIAGFDVRESNRPTPIDSQHMAHILQRVTGFIHVQADTETIVLHYRTRSGSIGYLAIPLPEEGDSEQLAAFHIAEVLRVADPPVSAPVPFHPTASAPMKSRPIDNMMGFLNTAFTLSDLSLGLAFGLHLGVGYRFV